MRLIKRDIDKKLLTLIIVLLVVVISTITFYEFKLSRISNQYNKEREFYNLITASSIFEQLNKTSKLKETALKDKIFFEMKYNDLLAQNEKLKNQIENLKSELILAKSTEEYQKARDGGPVTQFRIIQSKNTEINKLKERIVNLCSQMKSKNISLDEC